jgi:hypothetical protein
MQLLSQSASVLNAIEFNAQKPSLNALEALGRHWPEYPMESAGLGFFMISACLFGALYENPRQPDENRTE